VKRKNVHYLQNVQQHGKQRGVAVVTALLLTTLAITIVASLFWQQQVQVRSIENQRFQLQKKWVLRGALDWARLILREDERNSPGRDHLGEPWAVTLRDTQLDQYVENGQGDTDSSEASLSGQITDAQSRFNLNNLALNGLVDAREVAVFSRLLNNLRMDSMLSQGVATMIASTQQKVIVQSGSSGANSTATPGTTSGDTGIGANAGTGSGTSSNNATSNGTGSGISGTNNASSGALPEVQFMRFSQFDDLLAAPGFTPEMVMQLKDFVAVLPQKTALNLNTTSKEVMAARLNISLSDAALIVIGRDRAYFRDMSDFENRFPDKLTAESKKDVSFATNYFFVNGKVKLSRSALEVNALIERTPMSTKVLWIREN
jgi:general secretion pathway protein K